MSTLICHSCGAGSSPDGSANFTKCEYCGAAISVAKFFKDSSTDTLASLVEAGLSEDESKKISRLFKDAEHQIKISEYATARGNFEEILKLYPGHIPSRINLANCLLFNTDNDPLERGKRVRDHLINANSAYQETPEIIDLKSSVAFNIASMGANITDGMKTIELFKISKQVSNENVERDKLIRNFYEELSPKLLSRVQNGLKKSKGKFSPSVTDLKIMIEGSCYEPSIKNLCTKMYQHMIKNKNLIHKRSLEMLDALEAVCDHNVQPTKEKSKIVWYIGFVVIILIIYSALQ
jgi:hypothetical protein